MFSDPLVARLAEFVRSVGLDVLPASSLLPANFPGLDIQNGAVLIDETRVVYPGDILHEAGHLATTDPGRRGALRLSPTGGEEMSTMAWSYAAVRHLELDPELVFYPSSYGGLGPTFVEKFAAGTYIGTPLLRKWGMAPEYPRMTRWLR